MSAVVVVILQEEHKWNIPCIEWGCGCCVNKVNIRTGQYLIRAGSIWKTRYWTIEKPNVVVKDYTWMTIYLIWEMITSYCSSSLFCHLFLCCAATFVIFFPFLLVFGRFSTFLLPLPFLDLSSHNSAILGVVFLVSCNLLVILSHIFSVVSHCVSSPFHPALTYLLLLGLCLGWYGHLMVLYKTKFNWITWSPPKYVLLIIFS